MYWTFFKSRQSNMVIKGKELRQLSFWVFKVINFTILKKALSKKVLQTSRRPWIWPWRGSQGHFKLKFVYFDLVSQISIDVLNLTCEICRMFWQNFLLDRSRLTFSVWLMPPEPTFHLRLIHVLARWFNWAVVRICGIHTAGYKNILFETCTYLY